MEAQLRMEEIEEEGSSLDSPSPKNQHKSYAWKEDSILNIDKNNTSKSIHACSKGRVYNSVEKQVGKQSFTLLSPCRKQKCEIHGDGVIASKTTKPAACESEIVSKKDWIDDKGNVKEKIPEICLNDEVGNLIRIAIGEDEENESNLSQSSTTENDCEFETRQLDKSEDSTLISVLKIDRSTDFSSSLSKKIKPRKESPSSPFRIQVTLHRPLNWQVSASSSSSSIPRKSIRRSETGDSSVKYSVSDSVSFSISPTSKLSKDSVSENNVNDGFCCKDDRGFHALGLNCKSCGKSNCLCTSAETDALERCNCNTDENSVSINSNCSTKKTNKKASEHYDLTDQNSNICTFADENGLTFANNSSRKSEFTKKTNLNTVNKEKSCRQRKSRRVKRIQMTEIGSSSSSEESGVSDSELLDDRKDKFSGTRYHHHLHHPYRRGKKRQVPSSSSIGIISHKCSCASNTKSEEKNTNTNTTSLSRSLPGILKVSKSTGCSNSKEEFFPSDEVNKENLRKREKDWGEGGRSQSSNRDKTTNRNREFPPRESHGVQDCHPVMTWFKEPVLHVNNKESGMGANGSTNNGRLKSRSQSSSALYCIGKASNGSGQQSNYENYTSTANGLSTSIPADIWDLPATAKSYSPITHKHNSNNQNQRQNLKNRSGGPVVDAIASRAAKKEKDGKFSGGSRKAPASNGGANRSKLYAISCPDVAQHTENESTSHPTCADLSDYHNQYSYSTERGIETAGRLDLEDDYSRMCRQAHPQGSHNTIIPDAHHHSHGDISLSSTIPPPSSFASASTSNINTCTYSHSAQQSHQYHHQQHQQIRQQQQRQLQHQTSLQSLQSQNAAAYYQSNRSISMDKPKSDDSTVQNKKCSYPGFPSFVTEDSTYEVRLKRDLRGLGLSVTGGLDSQENYPGLIRIKKVFPMGPAFQSGRLRPWDIILKANGVPLTGLTNHEALEVLRTTPLETILTICRPPPNIPGFFEVTEYLQSQTNQSQTLIQSRNQYPHPNQQQQQQHHRPLHQPNCPHQLNYQKQMHFLQQQHSQQLQQQQQQQVPYRHESFASSASVSSSAFNPSAKSKSLSSLKIPTQSQTQQESQESYGEFEVTLEKIAGSLGFTLRQEDSSVLGHYVRALVKDPALSDGRIQPGDRILSVNGQDLSEMSHGDAITFLRQCSRKVKLRLYRDVSPTPISPLSPTESHKVLKAKPFRQEALDMLNDLALRKQMSGSGSDPKHSLSGSAVGRTGLRGHKVVQHDEIGPATLPRRRPAPGPGVTPSPEVLSAALDRFAGKATQKSNKSQLPESMDGGGSAGKGNSKESQQNHMGGSGGHHLQHSHHHNYPAETRSSGSGESTPAGTIIQPKCKKTDRQKSYELRPDKDTSTCENNDEIDHSDMEVNEPTRKPSFRQFTLHLDRISSLDDDNSFSSDLNHHDSIVSEPGFTSAHNSPNRGARDGSNFRHGQPAYQSAILPSTTKGNKMRSKGTKLCKEAFGSGFRLGGGDSTSALSDFDIPSTFSSSGSQDTQQTSLANQLSGTISKASDAPCSSSSASGTSNSGSTSNKGGGLLKWKGVLFSQDDNDDDDEDFLEDEDLDASFRHPVGASGGSKIGKKGRSMQDDFDELFQSSTDGQNGKNSRLPQRRSPDGREFRECDMEISSTTQFNGEQIFTVQLSRRWCSRLGFSLQGSEGHTFISAIYPDSVAAKDGRLRVGDEVIMINGETVRDVETPEVIDMMRKIRGVISITLLRKPDTDEANPSDHQLGLT